MEPSSITISVEWLIGSLGALIAGSYIFTWKVYALWRRDKNQLWDAIQALKNNEIKHLDKRISKLEGK